MENIVNAATLNNEICRRKAEIKKNNLDAINHIINRIFASKFPPKYISIDSSRVITCHAFNPSNFSYDNIECCTIPFYANYIDSCAILLIFQELYPNVYLSDVNLDFALSTYTIQQLRNSYDTPQWSGWKISLTIRDEYLKKPITPSFTIEEKSVSASRDVCPVFSILSNVLSFVICLLSYNAEGFFRFLSGLGFAASLFCLVCGFIMGLVGLFTNIHRKSIHRVLSIIGIALSVICLLFLIFYPSIEALLTSLMGLILTPIINLLF